VDKKTKSASQSSNEAQRYYKNEKYNLSKKYKKTKIEN
jgi:hypothetical protein